MIAPGRISPGALWVRQEITSLSVHLKPAFYKGKGQNWWGGCSLTDPNSLSGKSGDVVASRHGHARRRDRGPHDDEGRSDALAGGRRAVGRTPAAVGHHQAAQEAGPAPAGRSPDLRRPDLAGAHRQPVGGAAARVRPQVHGPRAVPRMGRARLLRTGLGPVARGLRRRGGPRLAVAGRRRVPRQGPAREKGGPGEAEATGRNPTDRGKCGTKRHLLTTGEGLPLAVVLSGANRTDMKKL